MEKTLIIREIFRSIQGESTRVGLPCVFVRLAGCDLRCSYCDTETSFAGGERKTVPEIAAEVRGYGTEMVEITGGEPLLQPAVHDLMRTLAEDGHRVLLETSGAHDISSVDPRVVRIVDVKCPSSGEAARNRWDNLARLRDSDEVKFVIGDRADFDWAVRAVGEHRLTDRCAVLFSAVWDVLPLQTLAEWILDSRVKVRVQPQLHKILWGTTPST
jgi:7-carboxy-7-deazaguanine synthase